MPGLLDEFSGITHELNQRSIDYAVCGGWAVAIHGFLRATLDIDLLILTRDLDKALEAAREKGFDIEGLPQNFDGGKTMIHRISKIDHLSKELITLDLILVTDIYKDVWESRKRVIWNQGEYSIVSRNGLIKMKEISGRPKDIIDLDYLRGVDNDED